MITQKDLQNILEWKNAITASEELRLRMAEAQKAYDRAKEIADAAEAKLKELMPVRSGDYRYIAFAPGKILVIHNGYGGKPYPQIISPEGLENIETTDSRT